MSFAAIAIGTTVASVGGALISSSAQSSAQKKGLSTQNRGLDALESAQNDTVGSDAFKNFMDAITAFSKNPNTYTPEAIAGIKGRLGDAAVTGAQNTQNAAWERAGAQGAYRDSSTRANEARVAQGLGGQLADISRSTDEMAAKQRIIDMATLGSLLQGAFNLREAPAQAFANAAIGVGSNQASYNASPFGDALKGLGTIGTAVGSAQRPYTYGPDGKITGGGGTGFGSLFG